MLNNSYPASVLCFKNSTDHLVDYSRLITKSMFLPSHDNQIAKIFNEFFIKPSIILLINISTSEKYKCFRFFRKRSITGTFKAVY